MDYSVSTVLQKLRPSLYDTDFAKNWVIGQHRYDEDEGSPVRSKQVLMEVEEWFIITRSRQRVEFSTLSGNEN